MNDAIVWGGVLYALSFGFLIKRRKVLDTPTARATSAAVGRAELFGRARGDPPQESLVSGTPCAHWQVRLMRRVRQGNRTRTQCVAVKCADAGHFWVEDDSGRVPVLIDGASWWYEGVTTLRSRKGDPVSPRVHEWLRRLGFEWNKRIDLRIEESRLEEGGDVYVLGTLSPAPDVLRAPPGGRPSGWRFIGHLVRSGFKPPPPDDALSRYVTRRREGRPPAAGDDAPVPAWLTAPEGVCMWKGPGSAPFLIANGPERVLARRLGRWALNTMAGGSALMLLGVAELFK
jgi:hypothetical protein